MEHFSQWLPQFRRFKSRIWQSEISDSESEESEISDFILPNPRSRISKSEISDFKSEISDFTIEDLKSLDSKQNMCSKVWKSYSPIEHFHDRYQHLWCIIGSLFMN